MRAPLLVLLALMAGGCVSLQRGGIYQLDRDRVFVEYFFNETFYRDVEFQLTERVVKEILSSPGLHLSTKDASEVWLSGRVLSVTQSVLTETTAQEPQTSSTTVSVEVTLTRAHTGEVLKTAVLTASGQSVAALGQTYLSAQDEALKFLARDIVRQFEREF